eukprot:6103438-Amphidinium_carterae.2
MRLRETLVWGLVVHVDGVLDDDVPVCALVREVLKVEVVEVQVVDLDRRFVGGRKQVLQLLEDWACAIQGVEEQ